MHNKWPHVVGKKFINLSLVIRQPWWSDTEVKPQAPKYLDAMFHGKISEVDAKHCMTMSDIAKTKDGSVVKGMQRCILVEGAPGVGKSTFAWKVVRKWGKGKILQQYQVMLLLRLREKRVRSVKTEEDLFKLFRPIATKELCESGGEGVFLLLDGWDELPANLRKDSFFFDLLKGQVLPDATVMVTSRPHASESILNECEGRIFQHIQIAGFTEENVQTFIRINAGEVLEGLKTYITFYPHIASMMCNPLSAAIVVKVYKDSYKENSPIPKTTTELYSSLVRSLLLRYLKEVPDHSKKSWRLRQLSDLPEDVYEKVLKISELAFRGITNNHQVVFDESDLPAGFDTLSILQCVPELYIDEGTVLSYNFLHLTIQEYFAAYHMSLQPTETQVKMFHDHKLATSMKMVLLFFAGLTHFKGISEDDIISLLGLHGYRKKVGTERLFRIMSSNDGIRYLFEANTRISVLDALEDVRITLPHTTLFDCYVLGFIISSTACSWDVNIYNISPKSLLMLARGTVEQSKQCGTGACKVELDLSNWIRTKRQLIDCGSLSTAHPMFLKRLTKLKLENMCLNGNPFVTPHLQLESLVLNGSHWCESQEVLCSLCDQKALETLILTNGDCHYLLFRTQAEHIALSEWLSSPGCNLKTLNIAGNCLNQEATKSIMTALCQNHTLKELDISNKSKITPEVLERCLPQLSLFELSLNECNIEDSHVKAIVRALHNNTKLEMIHIRQSRISKEAVLAFVDLLKTNTTLKKVDVKDCLIKRLSSQFIANVTANGRLDLTVYSASQKTPPKGVPLYTECYKYCT